MKCTRTSVHEDTDSPLHCVSFDDELTPKIITKHQKLTQEPAFDKSSMRGHLKMSFENKTIHKQFLGLASSYKSASN